MLGLYLASVAYVNAEIKILGPDNPLIAKSRESRAQHFLDSLVSMSRDIVDSANALEEMAKATPAFSKAQRDTMASAVSAYMQGSDVAIAGKSKQMQNHPNITGALTESLWSVICDAQLSLDDKCEEFVKHCVAILGLRKPNDATLKDILGILEMCSKKELTPDERLSWIGNIRDKFKDQRSLFPGRQTMREFPNDVNDFLQCHPPVPSRSA